MAEKAKEEKGLAMAEKAKEEKALRLKSQAEVKYRTSCRSALKYARRAQRLCPNLDGISQMVTTFKVLRTYKYSSSPNWYKILQLEPFSPISTVRRQYKNLALILHPDKNISVGSDDAFKAIGLALRVLSDKALRRRFDADLRATLRSRAKEAGIETFWTACSACRLFHEFDRKHVGKRLVCPSCKKPFVAVDVGDRVTCSDDDRDQDDDVRGGARLSSEKKRSSGVKSLVENRKGKIKGGDLADDDDDEWLAGSDDHDDDVDVGDFVVEESVDRKRKVTDLEKSGSEKVIQRREMTLAEMQLEVIQKLDLKKKKKNKKDEKVEGKAKEIVVGNESRDLMSVEDPDFYDFDKDRIERSFKKGQVWAVYDDDDGMPRHYGLIDEVVSVNPFVVNMNWLDLQSNGEEALICWEKMGFHISCGRFKVGRKIDIDSVNLFSHLVECERAARYIYRIYPKKGSVWALYSEGALDGVEGTSKLRERRCYDVVVFLTSYSETHGLSMAYLEKVEGFKTIFKRREIGCHAIKWLEKDDVRLFSHQIPARKLLGEEAPELPKDCWELDPASLPLDMLRIGWGK
ncbi:uncharacterized protein LOC131247984 isoform X2 [Magnolia sinica]|uniref:uncharacterized protein LOC131247984 isoform X2 n=1 Tax=Magnolia sinica TaxID=86752 RepID=UPI00265A8B7C|nr:uncharacterized protein LOC131247984 isoform X2 [Magnolia sinica]